MKSNAQVFQNGPLAAACSYCLIGDGKLARHLAHYFELLGIPLRRWSRRLQAEQGTSWSEVARGCSRILLAVSDRAIEPLAREISSTAGFENTIRIHFSGSLHTSFAAGAHPLMSFAETLYTRDVYEQIPFITVSPGPKFSELFPELKNPSASLPLEKKGLYHAWCVMGGNFTAFLWTRMFETFAHDLGLDPALAAPYLKKVTENLLSAPESARGAWTGPIVRGDLSTIDSHLQALREDPYSEVYSAFLRAHLSAFNPQLKGKTS